MKKITIMIPTYNQSKYITQAIKSAQEIDYDNLEIVVSDDCSTDDTQEVVSKLLEDKRVKYFKNSLNLGRVGNYRKTLYEYATGDYVLNLDGDDWLEKNDFFMEAVKILNNELDMSCVLGDRQNYNDTSGTYKVFRNKNIDKIIDGNSFFINMPTIGFIFSHLAVLYRRDLAMKVGFYEHDILSSDSASINKLYLNHTVGYLPYIVGNWRIHQENESHKNLDKKMQNIQKYNYLFEFAKKMDIFDEKLLQKWLDDNQSSTLAQDFLYYMKLKKVVLAFRLLQKSFQINFLLGTKVFATAFKRGIKSI